jgi:hypothetical protein
MCGLTDTEWARRCDLLTKGLVEELSGDEQVELVRLENTHLAYMHKHYPTAVETTATIEQMYGELQLELALMLAQLG